MAGQTGRVREADLVHVHDFRAFLRWYLPFRFLLPGTPVFITFHGYEGWPLPPRVIRLRRLVRRLCAGAIGVGGFIERHYGTPCDRIVVGGVRRAEGVEGDRDGRRGALFLGRLAPDLSADRYLEALSELARVHGKALPLDVLGDGPLRETLERRAVRLGIEARFHGWVDDPFPHLARARAAFVDSYLAILEAMACGTPVFSIYKNPLKRDYLESIPRVAEFMTVRGSAEGLARDLAAWIDDPAPIAERAQRALEAVRELTWASVARTYLDLYGEKGV
jgi:glycosyltransferase involved in cell wall biosynthesis